MKNINFFSAENIIGRYETKARLIVLPIEKKKKAPEFKEPLHDKTVTEAETAIFEVTVEAEPLAQFKWTLNDKELVKSNVSFYSKLKVVF